MSRARTSKESEFTEENLVGKSIVDPKGDIIAKCVALVEDEKKRVHMRISVTTDISSEFIVEELIPVSIINKIGEVILLKKAIEIKPVVIEDIVTFDIPDSQSTSEQSDEVINDNNENIISEKSNKISSTKSFESTDKIEAITKREIVSEKIEKKSTKKNNWSFLTEFNLILTSENGDRPVKIKNFVLEIDAKASRRKAAIKSLLEILAGSDSKKRLISAEILVELADKNASSLITNFKEGLTCVYNEPSKEVERLLLKYLSRVASINDNTFTKLKIEKFFEKLIIKRDICKPITMNRIHNINLKIFVNNYDVQEIIVSKYLTVITKKRKESKDFALILKDYNAILIAYSLIRTFKKNNWEEFLESDNIRNVFDESFRNSIDRILQNFLEGNIKALSEIIDPKLGFNYSTKVITNMIKSRLDDFLSNVTILPLDVLTAFFQDDEKRAVKIIFDLINKSEINAQIVFIENKTYISSEMDKN